MRDMFGLLVNYERGHFEGALVFHQLSLQRIGRIEIVQRSLIKTKAVPANTYNQVNKRPAACRRDQLLQTCP
jgi:hypothetical protein